MKKSLTLILTVLLVLTCGSSVFAAGIAEGWRAAFGDDASGTYKIGSTADFLGYNWKLWKTDDEYAYVITTDNVGWSRFNARPLTPGYYEISVIRGFINNREKEMKNYSGSDKYGTAMLSWSEINGGSANYIAHSPTWDSGVAEDCLYLLSKDEAETMSSEIRTIGHDWWLRSRSFSHSYSACIVQSDGVIGDESVNITLCVRPALIINLKSPLFLSLLFRTAPSGKAYVNVGGGFALKDYDGADGWKFTLIDKNITTPEILLGANGGNKIDVYYTVASAGENMYLSALLYDLKGKLINYAKVARTKTKGIVAAELPLDNLPSGQYKVRFFSERINGEGKHDYASELTKEYEIFTPHILKTAPNGKTAVQVSKGFTLAPYDGSNGWKLTEQNENIAAPTVNVGMNVSSVSVLCTGEPEVGEDRYLSALLYDENGEIINYAKVAKITQASIFSGKRIYVTAKIPLDNITPGNYRIRFFYEQIKGAEENDIASNLTKEYDLRIPDKVQLNTAVLQNENALMSSTSLDSVKIVSQEKSVALLDEDYVGVSGVKETNLKDGLDITLTHGGFKADGETAQFQIKLDKPIKLAEGRQLAVFIPLPDRTEEENENLALKGEKPANNMLTLAAPTVGSCEENEYLVLKDEDPADDMVTFTVPNVGKYFESGETVPVTLAEINGDAKFDGEEEQKKSSSSGGCNAGFGILALLCAAPMIFRKKH